MLGTWLLILVVFGSVAGFELPGIIKKKQWKELAVYSAFLILGFIVTVMDQVLKLKMEGIADWFTNVFTSS